MMDYYEFLQISPNAELETVHRVYRYLAARLHPDNSASGNPEQFRLLNLAYEVLSNSKKRAEYDAERRRFLPEPLSSSVDFMDDLEGELNRRLAVLAVLYRRRRTSAIFPEVSLIEIEERMGFPRDYLDFTLWYLQKKGYVGKTDSGQYTLTADGVDFVETQRAGLPKLHKMLTSGPSTAEEIEEADMQTFSRPMAADAEEFGNGTHSRPGGGSDSGSLTENAAQTPYRDWQSRKPDRRVGSPDLRAVKTERRAPKSRRANRPGE